MTSPIQSTLLALQAAAARRAGTAQAPRRHAPPTQALTRQDAAALLVDALRAAGYETTASRFVGQQGPVTVHASNADGGATIWLLLDGRLKVTLGRARDEKPRDARSIAIERIARRALAGKTIEAAARADSRAVGPYQLEHDSAGSWHVGGRRKEGRRDSTFPTLADAVHHAEALKVHGEEAPIPPDLLAHVELPVNASGTVYHLARAKVRGWFRGSPSVEIPYEFRINDGSVKYGVLIGHDDPTHSDPHFRYMRVSTNADGTERWGAQHFTPIHADREEMQHARVISQVWHALPKQRVRFDGATVDPQHDRTFIEFDDEPSEHIRAQLRRGWRRTARSDRTWERDEDKSGTWFHARRIALLVEREREEAREAPPSSTTGLGVPSRGPHSRQRGLASHREVLRDAERHLAAATHKLRSGDAKKQEEAIARPLRLRDEWRAMGAIVDERGFPWPLGSPAPPARDFRARLSRAPERVAFGVELWEAGGRVLVRLGAEPGEWLADRLREIGFRRSQRGGEDRIWWATSGPLAQYWAHSLAERLAETDLQPDLKRERFTGPLADDAEMPVRAVSGSSRPPPPVDVLLVDLNQAHDLMTLAHPGQDVATWEARARAAHDESRSDERPDERFERDLRAVRAILPALGGRFVVDAWWNAYRAMWGGARTVLLAARLYADQPVVAAAAAEARAIREAAVGEDAVITTTQLAALWPAGTSKIERSRGARALFRSLVALGLADPHQRHYSTDELALLPEPNVPAVSGAVWGWLLRHDLHAQRRAEVTEEWVLTSSLPARLLGVSAEAARDGLDAAVREGWIVRVQGPAGATYVLPDAPASSRRTRTVTATPAAPIRAPASSRRAPTLTAAALDSVRRDGERRLAEIAPAPPAASAAGDFRALLASLVRRRATMQHAG